MRTQLLTFWFLAALATGAPAVADDLDPRRIMEVPPNREGRTFVNPWPHERKGFIDFLTWVLGLGPKEEPAVDPARVPEFAPPVTEPDWTAIASPPTDQVQVTWIGHATFLVQAGGLNILTDPIFSKRATPVWFVGPKRRVPPGIPFERLPPIDAVVISHNHYDHLDKRTVKRLGNTPRYFVPLGMARWFERRGITNVTELDWGMAVRWRGVEWMAAPIQHFSGRIPPFDQDRVLWAAWVMQTTVGNVYFAGDTGYGPFFGDVGEAFGPFRVALLPIGAYAPRWFMSPVHIDAREAVKAHIDLRAEHSVGMHWATFRLTSEPMAEPPIYLRQAQEALGVPHDAFHVLAIGETTAFGAERVLANPNQE